MLSLPFIASALSLMSRFFLGSCAITSAPAIPEDRVTVEATAISRKEGLKKLLSRA